MGESTPIHLVNPMSEGKALIFSAPSGAGKTTIVRHLMSVIPDLDFSISATTRSPRAGETHGHDYYFLEAEDFRDRVESDQFAEWEEVYEGTFYGTLRSEIERIWHAGNHVVFDVDVEGGLRLKKELGASAMAIFVKVPDLDDLRARLKERGSENEQSLERRVSKAALEMTYEHHFDCTLLNDDLEQAKKLAEEKVRSFIQ